MRFQTHTSL